MNIKPSLLFLVLLTYYQSFSLDYKYNNYVNLHRDSYFLGDTISTSNDTISITAVGDIMLGTNYPNKSYLPPNDGKMLLDSVKQFLEKGDLTFGNFEGVIGNGGKPKSFIRADFDLHFGFKQFRVELWFTNRFTSF